MQIEGTPGVTPYSFSVDPDGSLTGPAGDLTHDPWDTGQPLDHEYQTGGCYLFVYFEF